MVTTHERENLKRLERAEETLDEQQRRLLFLQSKRRATIPPERAKKISTSCHFRLDCRHLASISLPLILIVSDLIRMMLKQFVNFFFFCGLSCCLYIILPMSFGHERTVYSALLYSSLYLLFNRREKSWNRGKRIDNSNRVRVRYVHGNLWTACKKRKS